MDIRNTWLSVIYRISHFDKHLVGYESSEFNVLDIIKVDSYLVLLRIDDT